MYENLVAWLRDKDFEPICPCGDENICEGKDCAVLQAADAIEELSRELDSANELITALDSAAPRWIPVTERLPQIGRNVLIFSARGRCAEGEFSGSGWWQYRWGAWINSQEVTHWMPLPESPEGGADG